MGCWSYRRFLVSLIGQVEAVFLIEKLPSLPQPQFAASRHLIATTSGHAQGQIAFFRVSKM
jgi:hypothetical protein